MKPEDQINFGISRVDIDDSNCMEHGSYRTLTLSRAGTEVFVHTFVIATTSHALRAAYTHSLNAFTPWNYQLFLLRKTSRAFNMSLQHLPLSPGINPGFPVRLVAGDSFPGRHVARDKWNGKARMGFLPGRHSRATSPGPHCFSQTIKCHGGRFSRATCRPGYEN
ncbi:hypothetical protein Tco_1444520 [Tanacetum coccineum]